MTQRFCFVVFLFVSAVHCQYYQQQQYPQQRVAPAQNPAPNLGIHHYTNGQDVYVQQNSVGQQPNYVGRNVQYTRTQPSVSNSVARGVANQPHARPLPIAIPTAAPTPLTAPSAPPTLATVPTAATTAAPPTSSTPSNYFYPQAQSGPNTPPPYAQQMFSNQNNMFGFNGFSNMFQMPFQQSGSPMFQSQTFQQPQQFSQQPNYPAQQFQQTPQPQSQFQGNAVSNSYPQQFQQNPQTPQNSYPNVQSGVQNVQFQSPQTSFQQPNAQSFQTAQNAQQIAQNSVQTPQSQQTEGQFFGGLGPFTPPQLPPRNATAEPPPEFYTFKEGTPILYCAYGLPVPEYNTPRKKCIPWHPMCGILFTCIMDV